MRRFPVQRRQKPDDKGFVPDALMRYRQTGAAHDSRLFVIHPTMPL